MKWLLALAIGLTLAGKPTQKLVRIAYAGGGTASGLLKGASSVTYVMQVKQGQTFRVVLQSKKHNARFDVLDAATHAVVDAVPTPRHAVNWSGILPMTGKVAVVVYLEKDAARRGETAQFEISLALANDSTRPRPTDFVAFSQAVVGKGLFVGTGGGAAVKISDGRLSLEADGTARLEFGLEGGKRPALWGRWVRLSGNAVRISLSRGLSGTIFVTLRDPSRFETAKGSFMDTKRKGHGQLFFHAR